MRTIMGEETTLQKYVASYRTMDMLDFSKTDFDKAIKTTTDKKIIVISNYPLVKLGSFAEIAKGKSITKAETKEGNVKVVAGGVDYAYLHNVANREANTITISASGANAGFVNFWKEPIFASDCTTVRGRTKIETLYLYNFLQSIQDQIYYLQKGSAQPHVYPDDIADLQIPQINEDLMQKIVAECLAVDNEYNAAQETILTAKQNIRGVFDNLQTSGISKSKLTQLCVMNPSKSELGGTTDDTIISFVEMASVSNEGFIENKIDRKYSEVKRGGYTYFAEGDIIIAKITPCMENGKCAIANGLTNGIGFGSSEFHVFRCDNSQVLTPFVFGYLNRESIRNAAAARMTGASGHRRVPIEFYEDLEIPVPSLAAQQQLIAQVEQYESAIRQAQAIMDGCAARKKAILDKYLD